MFHCLNVNCSEQLELFYQLVSAFVICFLVRITPKNIVGFVAQEDGFVARSALSDSGHDEIMWYHPTAVLCFISEVADLCDLTI